MQHIFWIRGPQPNLLELKKPWLVGDVKWTDKLIKKAVVGLALELKKAVLTLTEADYIENGMSDLLISTGNAYDLNIRIFNDLQNTITGWPGGKPNADDSRRQKELSQRKRELLFLVRIRMMM
jgi:glucosamine-6-phosphate deaminase